MAAVSQLPSTVSLLQDNLAASSNGWLACVHNSVSTGGRLLLHALATGVSKEGPEVSQVSSMQYLELPFGPVLVVCSTAGTQIYTEDASALIFFTPVTEAANTTGNIRSHKGASYVPTLQHVVVGTSRGSLLPIQLSSGSLLPLTESLPSEVTGEVADVCFSPISNTVVSVHSNSDIRVWTPVPVPPYTNSAVLPFGGQGPVRVAALGSRVVVAFGSGTLCLYDAVSHELQVEITAHGRWITGLCVREELSQIITVSEDTVLNVWQVEPSTGQVALQHSAVVTEKLLTGVALHGAGAAVTAYDSDEIFHVSF